MTAITPAMIKDLRERTGSGMSDCKKALVETSGDLDKAIEYLRKKGLAAASKKEGRIASEGLITQYIHAGGRIGVLLETNCETDFVARNEDFLNLTKEVMLQIAAMAPRYVTREEVPADMIEKEREIRRAAAIESGKQEKVVDRIVDGQIEKWMKEVCLLDQPWVKDDKKTIEALVKETVSTLGENIRIRRFVRWEVGEGLEKKSENFAEEVAKQAGMS